MAALAAGSVEAGTLQAQVAAGAQIDVSTLGGGIVNRRAGVDRAGQRDVGLRLNLQTAAVSGRAQIDAAAVGLGEVAGQNTDEAGADVAQGRGDRDNAAVEHFGCADIDAPGRPLRCGAGVDAAAVFDAVAGFEHDAPAALRQSGGFNAPAVADDTALQAVQRLGRQDNETARRQNGVVILHQGVEGGGLNPDVGQRVVAVKLQLKTLTGGQRHGTELGNDDAVVAHFRRQQRDVATEGGLELAFIHNGAGCAIARELVFAGHEVGIADAVRGGDEAADIDAGTRCKVDAVGIAEVDLAIGADLAEDLARAGVEHAVQGDAGSRRLLVGHAGGTADVVAAPVNGGAVAALVDEHGRTTLTDGGLPGHHLAIGG